MKQKTLKTNSNGELEYNISKAFLGIFMVVIGLVFLMNNLNILFIGIDLVNLWPLLIIFIGLSLFKKRNVTSTVVGSIITIMCAILFFYSIASYNAARTDFNYQGNTTPIVVTKDMNMKRATIELNAAAGKVNVYGIDSENLIEGRFVTNAMESKVTQSIVDSTQRVRIGFDGKKGLMKSGQSAKNDLNVGIDKKTPVDFILNSGASSNKIDLSGLQAENVMISAGASNLSLKLGDSVDSEVIIEAGASSVGLKLPDTVGVRIKVESGLSSQELPGFTLIDSDTYQSSNYDLQEKTINIEITLGMASLKAEWYTPIKKSEISLFYYNQIKDEKNSCDNDYILPVKRTIINGDNQIKTAINLLIQGKLTEQEKSEGFVTEFPNKDFKLLDANLVDGILTLKFNEVPGFTTGGACRVKILGSEIIRTAKQFTEVKTVVFEPETLFEP